MLWKGCWNRAACVKCGLFSMELYYWGRTEVTENQAMWRVINDSELFCFSSEIWWNDAQSHLYPSGWLKQVLRDFKHLSQYFKHLVKRHFIVTQKYWFDLWLPMSPRNFLQIWIWFTLTQFGYIKKTILIKQYNIYFYILFFIL